MSIKLHLRNWQNDQIQQRKGIASSSWTTNPVSDNTYEVFYNAGGTIVTQNASKYSNYNIIIHIDGNEKISSGKGTKEEPYEIK